jgi:glycosyltransferase involved in cell wall biosynthesis
VRRLTIGIDASRAFVAQPTGTENYATQVTRGLVALDEHDYRLYCRRAPVTTPPPAAQVRVLRAPRLWTHTRLALAVARDRPDVLFVPAHVLPVVLTVPGVVTVHDLGHRAYPEAHTFWQRLYLEWSTRRHVSRATRLIADSHATRNDLVTHYGADPDRISVVYLGVDPALRPASAAAMAALRTKLGLADDVTYLLHVGTVQPRKNLGRLVEAVARLAAAGRDVSLLLAGRQGWGAEDPLALAGRLGIADRVRRIGYVPVADLPALYTAALAAVVPSLYEGFGLTALEAMACGCAVAVSDTSSLPEVVGQAGLYFDPGDVGSMASALGCLIDDPALRLRLRDAGQLQASSFTWQRCVAETQGVLGQAAEAGA